MLGNLVGHLMAGCPFNTVVAEILGSHIVTGDVLSIGGGSSINLRKFMIINSILYINK